MISGKMEFSTKIDNGGHFEKGRWVTLFTPLLDYIKENSEPYVEPTFEVKGKRDIPVFKQGACIGYRVEDVNLGTFTQSELFMSLYRPRNDYPAMAEAMSLYPRLP